MKLKVFITSSIVLLFCSCYYDNEVYLYGAVKVDCNTTPAAFNAQVKPLVLSKCSYSGCHNAGSSAGGVVLENYTQMKAKADRIYQRVVMQRNMPPGGSLASGEIAIIKCWIDGGAPNN